MFRWLLVLAGIGFLSLSFVARFKFPPLPMQPEPLDVAAATQKLTGEGYYHVALTATPDHSRTIYPTASARPIYTGAPTDRTNIFDLAAVEHEPGRSLDDLIGSVVTLPAGLADSGFSVWTATKGEEDKTRRERLLAPLAGTDLRIWVVSRVFGPNEPSLRDQWLRERTFTGLLTRLDEMEENIASPKLEHDWAEIRKTIEADYSRPLAADALLLVTDYQWHFQPYHIVPLADSDNRLYLRFWPDRVPTIPNTITGVLEVAPSRLYKDFGPILKLTLPDFIGTVSFETALAYNQRRARNVFAMQMLAGGCFAVALLLYVRYRFRRR